MNSFFSHVSLYILPIFLGVIFIVTCFQYVFRKKLAATQWKNVFSFRNLSFFVIGGRIANAVLLMYLQYSVWRDGGGMGNYFLTAPLSKDLPITGMKSYGVLFTNKFGYFLFYSWGRFWLSVVLSIFAAYMFYAFLKILRRKTERFFEDGELELGFLCALVVGWPLFVIFVPIIFISVVVISIIRLVFFKEAYTTLGVPFLLATATTIVIGGYLISAFGLGVLKV